MVQCEKCKRIGLKMREVQSAFFDGKSRLVCRDCASVMLGEQEPSMYVKKLK